MCVFSTHRRRGEPSDATESAVLAMENFPRRPRDPYRLADASRRLNGHAAVARWLDREARPEPAATLASRFTNFVCSWPPVSRGTVRRLKTPNAMGTSNRKVCQRKFWIQTELPLVAIADALTKSGIVQSANHDYENIYEWLECDLSDQDVELNVSRKHHDGNIDETEPLGFLLIGDDLNKMEGMVDSIAAQVEKVLQLQVTIGAIEHVGGDDFRYLPEDK